MLVIVFLLGTFLLKSLLDLMLFQSGTSRSFVSQSFGRAFDMNLRDLECPLRVYLANEERVST